MQRKSQNTLFLAQFGILLAIEAAVCFVPWLGSVPLGPIRGTLSHLPVIVTAILLGVGPGAAMGFFFGLFSFTVWTFFPAGPEVFVYTPFYSVGDVSGNGWSLVICFVPRILIGVVAGLTALGLRRALKGNRLISYAAAGVLGSLTNTLLVLGGVYLFFGEPYAELFGLSFEALAGAMGGVILTYGLAEAALGALAGYGVCRPVEKALGRAQTA